MLTVYFFVLICSSSSLFVKSFADSENVIRSLYKTRIIRVDKDVKRPVRFCQGFEDPTEIDCYMRSDIKPYVCTEPVSFNPCESLQRVDTFHYDHIIHKCVKVNVPACEGQIIRVLTLIQCLIYCHNKDPFALGKSRSMVFKLNQPKPYIPNEPLENERKKILKKSYSKSSSITESNKKNLEVKIPINKPEISATKTIDSIVMDSIKNLTPETLTAAQQSNLFVKSETENSVDNIFANTLNGDAELAEYIINGAPDLLKKESEPNPLTRSKISSIFTTTQPNINSNNNKTNADQNEKSDKKIFMVNESIEKKDPDNTEKNVDEEKVENMKIETLNGTKVELKESKIENESKDEKSQNNENLILSTSINTIEDPKSEMLLVDLTKRSDSTDKSKDDGFYLWDE